jgi:UDP:flavonoid glycosyltransferase YjiC (YdhE family)
VRYLFCSFAAPGFLHPLVGMAAELRRRGHAVAFASAPAAAPLLAAQGLARLDDPAGDAEGFDLRLWGHPVRTARDVPAVERAIAQFNPDALVTHQLCQAPVIARERTDVPLAVLGLAAYLWPAAHGAPPSGESASRRRGHLVDNVRLLNQARAGLRLPEVEPDASALPLLGELFLLRAVPPLVPDLADLPRRVHAVGACRWEPEAGSDGWDALRVDVAGAEAPLLYVSHGRTFGGTGFWPQLVEAFGGRAVRVVAAVGRMDQPRGEVPANFVVHDHPPESAVLPRAAAVLSTASTTPVLAALTHGLPNVLVPVGGEGPILAARLAEAGCGVRLDAGTLDAATLRMAVEHAFAPGPLRDASRALGDAFARMPGFGAAADLLERLGRAGAPVLRPADDSAVPAPPLPRREPAGAV